MSHVCWSHMFLHHVSVHDRVECLPQAVARIALRFNSTLWDAVDALELRIL